MNRNEEWQQFTSDIPDMPKELDLSRMKKKVHRKAALHYSLVSVRNLAIICAVLLAGFVAAVKSSPAFAEEMRDIPVLKSIANWIAPTNDGKKAALEGGYATEQKDIAETSKGILHIPYVMGDDSEVYFHTVIENEQGEGLFLQPIALFDADTGERITVDSISGALIGEASSNEYEWTLNWDHYHQNVKVIFSGDEFREYSEELTDCVEYLIHIDRKIDSIVYDVNQTFSVNGLRYTVKKVTINPMSTDIELDIEDGAEPGTERTMQLYFYLVDTRNGVRVGRAEEKEGLYYDYASTTWRSNINAGLFTFQQGEDYILGVDLISQNAEGMDISETIGDTIYEDGMKLLVTDFAKHPELEPIEFSLQIH